VLNKNGSFWQAGFFTGLSFLLFADMFSQVEIARDLVYDLL